MVFAFLILLILSPLKWIFENYAPEKFREKTGSYRRQLEVAEFVFKDAKNKSFGYLVYDHGQLTYHMDYLMWWLANKKYHVPLINNKQPLTYLIMYKPPIWAKGAHDYWKENVIKTKGKIINKKIFPNGITVEKLQVSIGESPVDPNYFQNLIFR